LFGGIIREKIFSLKELRKNGEDYPENSGCPNCFFWAERKGDCMTHITQVLLSWRLI
jgi:hypothetical protein